MLTIVLSIALGITVVILIVLARLLCVRRRYHIQKKLKLKKLIPPGNLGIQLNIEIEREAFARGGFGSVHKAVWIEDDGEQQIVAVKLINQNIALGGNKSVHQFLQELEMLQQCDHPNIVKYYEGGLGKRGSVQYWMVLEYMDGGNLASYLETHGPLQLIEILFVAQNVANGLAYLHPNIVHRDLKPANILLSIYGDVKITDFGLSKFKNQSYLSTLTVAGTHPYIAPEVFQNQKISEKCDIYSFGVLLWEMVANEKPWKGLTMEQIIFQILVQKQQLEIPESCPEELQKIILSCLQFDPSLRPQIQEIQIQLKELFKQEAIKYKLQQQSNIQLKSLSLDPDKNKNISGLLQQQQQQHSYQNNLSFQSFSQSVNFQRHLQQESQRSSSTNLDSQQLDSQFSIIVDEINQVED